MSVVELIAEQGLLLIPVLNILGEMIKESERIPDKYIPLILLAFGVAGAVGVLGLSANSIIQGVLITGAAVYGNQLVKQFQK